LGSAGDALTGPGPARLGSCRLRSLPKEGEQRSDPMILGANHTVSGKASDVEVYDLVIFQ
jgi:hypothetical protein